eukprot:scaffold543256_cov51-Prasinocladus_malaysianus.AAC.1
MGFHGHFWVQNVHEYGFHNMLFEHQAMGEIGSQQFQTLKVFETAVSGNQTEQEQQADTAYKAYSLLSTDGASNQEFRRPVAVSLEDKTNQLTAPKVMRSSYHA